METNPDAVVVVYHKLTEVTTDKAQELKKAWQ